MKLKELMLLVVFCVFISGCSTVKETAKGTANGFQKGFEQDFTYTGSTVEKSDNWIRENLW